MLCEQSAKERGERKNGDDPFLRGEQGQYFSFGKVLSPVHSCVYFGNEIAVM